MRCLGRLLILAPLLAVSAAASARSYVPPPPSLAERCGDAYSHLAADVFWFQASDGTLLDGATVGDTGSGVVLATEYPSELCRWLDLVPALQRRGLRVFLFDFRGQGFSHSSPRSRYAADVQAAVAEFRRRGTTSVELVGASLGGTASLVAAASLRSSVQAVVSLSGEANLTASFRGSGLNAVAAARRIRVPTLLLVAKHDRYLSVREAKRLYRAVRSRTKRLVVFPGSWHGWDLVYEAPFRARARGLVLSFLTAHAVT